MYLVNSIYQLLPRDWHCIQHHIPDCPNLRQASESDNAYTLYSLVWRANINQHPLPGKDHHHQNSAETQKGERCIPPSWQARPGGFDTTAFRPQQAQRTYAQETKNRSFPNMSLWWGGPDNRACSSDLWQTPTRANGTLTSSNSASPEIIWGLGGPEEDHQLHHCCWTGRVSEREEED